MTDWILFKIIIKSVLEYKEYNLVRTDVATEP